MKRGWIVGAAILAAIGLLVTWIARNTYWDYESVPTALQGEAAVNPFYAAQRFVEALGGRAERRLTIGTLPDGEGVVILAAWYWSLIESRRHQLERWVESGGRLIIGPTLIGGEEDLEQWAGIARELEPLDEEEAEAADTEMSARTEPGHCTKLKLETTNEPLARDEFSVCWLDAVSWLKSSRTKAWALRNDLGTQALRVEIGRGSVTMLNANPFGNLHLADHDHGALFVAATQLRRGDHVIFLSEEERASLLSLIWAYGAPVVVLALIALAFALWRSGVRFGPLAAPPDPARRSITEQIRGTGQFMARHGNQALHAAMVRAVQEAAQRYIPGYARLPAEERVRAIARLSGADPEGLTEIINYRGQRRAGDLRNAIIALELARRHIVEANNRKRNRHAS